MRIWILSSWRPLKAFSRLRKLFWAGEKWCSNRDCHWKLFGSSTPARRIIWAASITFPVESSDWSRPHVTSFYKTIEIVQCAVKACSTWRVKSHSGTSSLCLQAWAVLQSLQLPGQLQPQFRGYWTLSVKVWFCTWLLHIACLLGFPHDNPDWCVDFYKV